jgi:outer membrane murein-binding lipoprotein Lpp
MNTQCVAVTIAAVVLGAVFVAGCTSPTTTSPTPSTATSTAGTRDAFLDQFVVSMERELRNNTTVYAWVAKWQNGSAVSIQTQFRNVTSNQDLNLNRTVIRFASIDDATNYANNNTAGYLVTTNLTKAASLPYKAYQLTKGSAPTVYSAWTKIEIRDLRWDTIQQIEDTVIVDSVSASPSSSVATS